MTGTICYTCHGELQPEAKLFAATFGGQPQYLCRDCAEGIHNGNQVFAKERVVGEYLGECGDNKGAPI